MKLHGAKEPFVGRRKGKGRAVFLCTRSMTNFGVSDVVASE